jgi:hypothetical protein
MTNNEHNDRILSEICELQERIKELQGQIKPADPLDEVDLVVVNQGALEARKAEFAQADRLKAMLETVVNENAEQAKEPPRRRRREAAAED